MKICMPIISDEGLNSKVNNDFETTHFFLIFDIENVVLTIIDDRDSDNMLASMINDGVSTIIVKNMKTAAYAALTKRSELKLYRALHPRCIDNIRKLTEGQLPIFEKDQLIAFNGCAGSCGSCAKDCKST